MCTVTQMAAVAELEAGLISERTKAGLAAAKRRGVKLGTYSRALAATNRKAALNRSRELAPTLRGLRERGMSVRAIAEHLTKRKVPSPRGGPWSQVTVSRMLQRIEATRASALKTPRPKLSDRRAAAEGPPFAISTKASCRNLPRRRDRLKHAVARVSSPRPS